MAAITPSSARGQRARNCDNRARGIAQNACGLFAKCLVAELAVAYTDHDEVGRYRIRLTQYFFGNIAASDELLQPALILCFRRHPTAKSGKFLVITRGSFTRGDMDNVQLGIEQACKLGGVSERTFRFGRIIDRAYDAFYFRCLARSYVRADCKNRTRALSQNAFGNRAKHQFFKTSSAVRSERDQDRVRLFGLIEDD